jgi:hypothetical protein
MRITITRAWMSDSSPNAPHRWSSRSLATSAASGAAASTSREWSDGRRPRSASIEISSARAERRWLSIAWLRAIR